MNYIVSIGIAIFLVCGAAPAIVFLFMGIASWLDNR